MLHRAALAVPNLPPPENGSLRQAAQASVQRLKAGSVFPVSTPSGNKRPFPDSSSPSPSNLPPLPQRIRKDIQIDESEVEYPEKEILRSAPILENSPSLISPCSTGHPSPAQLVFTPVCPENLSCLNCDAKMTLDHQCEADESDSSWEDIEEGALEGAVGESALEEGSEEVSAFEDSVDNHEFVGKSELSKLEEVAEMSNVDESEGSESEGSESEGSESEGEERRKTERVKVLCDFEAQ